MDMLNWYDSTLSAPNEFEAATMLPGSRQYCLIGKRDANGLWGVSLMQFEEGVDGAIEKIGRFTAESLEHAKRLAEDHIESLLVPSSESSGS